MALHGTEYYKVLPHFTAKWEWTLLAEKRLSNTGMLINFNTKKTKKRAIGKTTTIKDIGSSTQDT